MQPVIKREHNYESQLTNVESDSFKVQANYLSESVVEAESKTWNKKTSQFELLVDCPSTSMTHRRAKCQLLLWRHTAPDVRTQWVSAGNYSGGYWFKLKGDAVPGKEKRNIEQRRNGGIESEDASNIL